MKKNKKKLFIIIGIILLLIICGLALIKVIKDNPKEECCSCCGPEQEFCIDLCCPCD